MLSLPSTEAAQGAAMPLPDTGEKDASVPSGRNTVMLPPDSYPGFCAAMAGISTLVARCSSVGVVVEVEFECGQHFRELQCPLGRTAQFVCYPDVAQAVDGETAGGVSHLERFNFAGIGSGETNHVVRDGVGNPDAVLLVDGEGERPDKLAGVLQRIAGLVLAVELRPSTGRPGEASRPGP